MNQLTKTGSANGPGSRLAQLCCQSGAYVVIGDIDRDAGEKLCNKCCEVWPTIPEPGVPVPPRAIFCPVDVTDYQSVLGLFDGAFERYKRIDHVINAVVATSNIYDVGDSFDHALTLHTVREVRPRIPVASTMH